MALSVPLVNFALSHMAYVKFILLDKMYTHKYLEEATQCQSQFALLELFWGAEIILLGCQVINLVYKDGSNFVQVINRT